MEHTKVNLLTINGGAAAELFAEEFKKVMCNINDVSVESDAAREITIKFKIKPSKDRQSATTTVTCSSKVISTSEHESAIFLSPKGEAYVANYKQIGLDFHNQEQQDQNPDKQ